MEKDNDQTLRWSIPSILAPRLKWVSFPLPDLYRPSLLMRKHLVASTLIIGCATLAFIFGVQHTEATDRDLVYTFVNGAVCMLVFCVAIVTGFAAAYSRRRILAIYAFAVGALILTVGVAPVIRRHYRIDATKVHLMDVYAELAKAGPPFPRNPDLSLGVAPGILTSHGYWVAEDLSKFEVFYHVGSDASKLAYPSPVWQHAGFGYRGPGVFDRD